MDKRNLTDASTDMYSALGLINELVRECLLGATKLADDRGEDADQDEDEYAHGLDARAFERPRISDQSMSGRNSSALTQPAVSRSILADSSAPARRHPDAIWDR